MTAELGYWVADWNLSRSEAALLLHGPSSEMIDATRGDIDNALRSYPTVKRFAVYVTGTPDIRATGDDLRRVLFGRDTAVLRIDQSDSDLPLLADVRVAKDVEAGASSVDVSVETARQRLDRGDSYMIYVERSLLPDVEEAVARAHLPHGRIVAYQYASPLSNPRLRVPGSGLTLEQANVDLSVILDEWLPLPSELEHKRAPDPHTYADGYSDGYQAGVRAGELQEIERGRAS